MRLKLWRRLLLLGIIILSLPLANAIYQVPLINDTNTVLLFNLDETSGNYSDLAGTRNINESKITGTRYEDLGKFLGYYNPISTNTFASSYTLRNNFTWTAETWVKCSGTITQTSIFEGGNNDMYLTTAGKMANTKWFWDFVPSAICIGNTGVCNGNWNHIAFIFNGTHELFLINGVVDKTCLVNTTKPPTTGYMAINGIGSENTNVGMDDVKISTGIRDYNDSSCTGINLTNTNSLGYCYGHSEPDITAISPVSNISFDYTIIPINFTFNASTSYFNTSNDLVCDLKINNSKINTTTFGAGWSNNLSMTYAKTPGYWYWNANCSQSGINGYMFTYNYFTVNPYYANLTSPSNNTVYYSSQNVTPQFNMTGSWNYGNNVTCDLNINGVKNETKNFTSMWGGYGQNATFLRNLKNYTMGVNLSGVDGWAGISDSGISTYNDSGQETIKTVDLVADRSNTKLFTTMPSESWFSYMFKGNVGGDYGTADYNLFVGTSSQAYVVMGCNSGEDLTAYNGTTAVIIQTDGCNNSNWRQIEFFINVTSTKYDVYIDGVKVASDFGRYSETATSITTVYVYASSYLNTVELYYTNFSASGSRTDAYGINQPMSMSVKEFPKNSTTYQTNWSVNCTQSTHTSYPLETWFFNMREWFKDVRAEEINEENITFFWDYPYYVNVSLGTQSAVLNGTNYTFTGLNPDEEYTFSWRDNSSAEGSYTFNVKTLGWSSNFVDWKKQVEVTTSGNSIEEDGAGINVQLNSSNFRYTDENGLNVPAFKYFNIDQNDTRFTDYYDLTPLRHNVTSYDCDDGGSTEYNPANETGNTSAVTDWANCWDGNWNTLCRFTAYVGNLSFNYTKPVGARDNAILRLKQGASTSVAESYTTIPTDCIGDNVALQTRIPGSSGMSYTYCLNQTNGTTWIELVSNCGYFFIESSIFWESECSANISVIPLGYDDETSSLVEKLDDAYDQHVWLYFNNSAAEYNMSELEVTFWNDTTVGNVEGYTATAPTISNIVTLSSTPYTSMQVNWSVNRLSNNRLRTAYNSELIGYMEVWNNSTKTPSFTVTGLMTNTTVYYEVYSEDISTGLTSTETGSNTTGSLISTPTVEWFSYTEYRGTSEAELCANITGLNGHANANVGFIWENQNLVNGSSTPETKTAGVYCKNVSLTYGDNYMFMAEVKYSTTEINHSASYWNQYLLPQPFFAGNPKDDDENNRQAVSCINKPDGTVNLSLCTNQSGYLDGVMVPENFIWIETTKELTGLNVSWYDGSSWTEYAMSNNSNFSYLLLSSLGSAYQTFYIHNATSLVLNWTAPSLYHPTNAGGTAGLTRIDNSKFVSFNKTATPVSYKILYLDKVAVYNVTTTTGGNMWGWPSESTTNGYLSDNGRFTVDAGQEDTGWMVDTNNPDNYLMTTDWGSVNALGANRRRCYVFTIFYWNSTLLPSDNITNYYYRGWEANQTLSNNGPIPIRDDDCIVRRDCLAKLNVSGNDWTCQEDTVIDTSFTNISNMNIHDVMPVNTFRNSYYSSFLSYRFKDGFVFDTSGGNIWDLTFKHQARYPSTQLNRFQQSFVIFNLPSNATLAGLDSDSDGLDDFTELFTEVTNPFDSDTDRDLVKDGDEVTAGTNPNVYNLYPNCGWAGGYNSTITDFNANCSCVYDQNVNLFRNNFTWDGVGTVNLTGNLSNFTVGTISGGCVVTVDGVLG